MCEVWVSWLIPMIANIAQVWKPAWRWGSKIEPLKRDSFNKLIRGHPRPSPSLTIYRKTWMLQIWSWKLEEEYSGNRLYSLSMNNIRGKDSFPRNKRILRQCMARFFLYRASCIPLNSGKSTWLPAWSLSVELHRWQEKWDECWNRILNDIYTRDGIKADSSKDRALRREDGNKAKWMRKRQRKPWCCLNISRK